MTSVFMALLFLIFAVGLPVLSLSTNAAQTESGNTPDSGIVSEWFLLNGRLSRHGVNTSTFGGSLVFSVKPNTEYYVRLFVGNTVESNPLYDSLGYAQFEFNPSDVSVPPISYSSDWEDVYIGTGTLAYATYHFWTGSDTNYVMLTLIQNGTDSQSVLSALSRMQHGSYGLGIYEPLADRSTAKLTSGFSTPTQLDLSLSGYGGVGDYHFTVDVIYNNGNVANLLTDVSSGDYNFYSTSFSALGDDDRVRVTISDRFTSITNDILPNQPETSVPDVSIISSPEVDISVIPDVSLSVASGFGDVFSSAFSSLPSAITALLIPCFILFFVGWWLRK